MSNPIKQIRGQIRQIILELLPEMMLNELYKSLESKINKRLDLIDSKQKDIMSSMVRNSMKMK